MARKSLGIKIDPGKFPDNKVLDAVEFGEEHLELVYQLIQFEYCGSKLKKNEIFGLSIFLITPTYLFPITIFVLVLNMDKRIPHLVNRWECLTNCLEFIALSNLMKISKGSGNLLSESHCSNF